MRPTVLRRTAAAAAVTTTLAGLAVAVAVPAAAGPEPVDVQLLALNDFHGALEPPTGSGGRIPVGPDPDGAGSAT